MDWRIILVLVLAGFILAGAVILGVMLALERKRASAAERIAEQWRGRYQESADVVSRLSSIIENKELTDEEAAAKLHAGIANWSPADPSGAGGPEN